MSRSVYSCANKILDELEFVGELFELWAQPWKRRQFYCEGRLTASDWNSLIESRKKKRAVYDMRRRKWLMDRKCGNRIVIKVHRDALVYALKRRICSKKVTLPKGIAVLVMFDFPNGANSARSSWRNLLFRCGFRRLQLSVWESDKDVFAEIVSLVRLLDLDRWVKVLKSEKIF